MPESVQAILSILGSIIVIGLLTAVLERIRSPGQSRSKKIAALKEQITKKLSAGITLTAKDVIDIGRGLGAPPSISTEALYQLFAESASTDNHATIRKLLDDISREDPFEALPEVSRPSLARITFLCEHSDQTTDRQLLSPIVKILEDYQEMKRDHASMKRRSRISYFLAFVSFIVGAYGLILAYRTPSEEFITGKFTALSASITQELKYQQVAPAGAYDDHKAPAKDKH